MTKITVPELLQRAQDAGCTVTPQKSFNKITCGENRKAVYVGHAKRVVTRVDISGFEMGDHAALKRLSEQDAKDLNLGAVRAQILPKDLSEDVTDADILEAFDSALSELTSESEGFKLGKAKKEEDESTEEAPEASEDEDSEELLAIAADAE